MLKVFWICVFVQVLARVQCCSRRRNPPPRPCSWRTCYHDWRDPFTPGVRQGQCVYQSRYSTHLYITNHGTGSCPASSSCDWRCQRRTRCSCREVQTCNRKVWSSWSGHIPTGQCARQTRHRGWNELNVRYREQDNNCNGIRSSCGSTEYDYRTLCSCPYARCETLPWTAWSTIQTRPGHCITVARYQRQRKTIVYKTQGSNCNGVGPQTCPDDVTQVQEKVVYCQALPIPAAGSWDRAECSQGQQRCNSLCTLECSGLKGYNRIGNNPTRKCLSSGSWSSSNAYCKDEEAPVITCPSPSTFGTDTGKKYKTVIMPQLVSATDNSGKAPTVTTSIGKTQHQFAISAHAYEVVFTARDETGNTRTCPWYVTVKDMEKPKVLECPKDITIISTKDKERVSWDDPKFQDNYDPTPRITSNRGTGTFFSFGKTLVTYKATDESGNEAICQFNIIISVLNCPVFVAPRNGAHTCNIKVDEKYEHHLYCSTHCQKGYAYISNDVYEIYQCTAGVWTGFDNFPPKMYKFVDTSMRPWVDCAGEDTAEGVKKVINAYVGTCNENNKEALEAIKRRFIATLNEFMLSKLIFCGKHQANCDISNVKVYCGKSKRSGDVSKQVVSVEIVIRDEMSWKDAAKALKQHEMMKMDLDATEMVADHKIVSKMGIAGMHLEGYESKLACKAGEILKVREGDGDELTRSSCVKCPEGTFFNDEEECIPCPEGTYQDDEGKMACIHCPEGTWTLGNQATNQTECIDVCGPGEYSQLGNGLATCIACPAGTFQPNFRQSKCLNCPSGKTTSLRGAASKDDCQ
ncbi:sushi, von Willebrand factor type A, EGF and pentraxin domain-containing protein 1-like [Dendronephthya gigantea]|uniref:sushi, von Willebrand factor type A, EGF and pentraxin domain-containing protein 1-like n=1 Tax=Dendronephthya gigantea TaxID=151771 RepID=UPI0010699A2A|nr:sushi, von Willebrand factor type A, EGF and pentraxin domain-containing protein 1-like [Dendronephthya gigantea]